MSRLQSGAVLMCSKYSMASSEPKLSLTQQFSLSMIIALPLRDVSNETASLTISAVTFLELLKMNFLLIIPDCLSSFLACGSSVGAMSWCLFRIWADLDWVLARRIWMVWRLRNGASSLFIMSSSIIPMQYSSLLALHICMSVWSSISIYCGKVCREIESASSFCMCTAIEVMLIFSQTRSFACKNLMHA